jgi:transposase
MRRAVKITLTEKEKETLIIWSRGKRTSARLVLRARILLLASEAKENLEIAKTVGTSRHTVSLWRKRFAQKRLSGIEKDAPRGGRKPSETNQAARRIIERTLQGPPANATHWSVRTLAKELKVAPTMVHRVWRANCLKPHKVKTFKISNDSQFIEKVIDITGLYLNPPERALVLPADEKSQIQALDRTQRCLSLEKGHCATRTHDYKRHGTTTLFAAMELAEGKLIGTCLPRHRHQEWIEFLKLIDRETPPELDLHLIIDNYGTHKHPKVKRWLKRHPRFHMHYLPTSSSWLNLIERWFRELTDKRLRRGVFRSVKELVNAIMEFIESHNRMPESYTWTAKAEEIIAKYRRARAVLDKSRTA